jgi:hypothetical protein
MESASCCRDLGLFEDLEHGICIMLWGPWAFLRTLSMETRA